MLPALVASHLMLVMVLLAFGKRPEHEEAVIVNNISRKECLMQDLDGWAKSNFSSYSDYLADKRA